MESMSPLLNLGCTIAQPVDVVEATLCQFGGLGPKKLAASAPCPSGLRSA